MSLWAWLKRRPDVRHLSQRHDVDGLKRALKYRVSDSDARHPDSVEVRSAALRALVEIDAEAAVPELIETFRVDRHEKICQEAWDALVTLRAERAIEHAHSYLSRTSFGAQFDQIGGFRYREKPLAVAVVRGLGVLRAPASLPILIECLDSATLGPPAADAMAAYGDSGASLLIRKLTEHRDRKAASISFRFFINGVAALQGTGSTLAIPCLVDLMCHFARQFPIRGVPAVWNEAIANRCQQALRSFGTSAQPAIAAMLRAEQNPHARRYLEGARQC